METNLAAELPFLAVEQVLVTMVSKAAANRQECHERIRQHSQAAAAEVKLKGRPNDLVDRLKSDPYFAPIHDMLNELLDPRKFIGRAVEQVCFTHLFLSLFHKLRMASQVCIRCSQTSHMFYQLFVNKIDL